MQRSRRSRVWWLIGLITVVAALSLLAIPPHRASGVTGRNTVPAAQLAGASASRPLRILVIGGTSGISLETVKRALERGHIVTPVACRAPTQAESSGRWRFVTGDIADAAAIRASAVDWTIVRPGFLTGKAAAGYKAVMEVRGVRSGAIARADVAHFIFATLESGGWSRQAVLLTN